MKVSLICTVYNEEKTIMALLESIVNQTRIPNEIVIVDAGSNDNTSFIINDFIKKLPIRLIISPGTNIATGRNIAISNALYDVIASTDGGCELDQNWFQNIIKPFEEGHADVVSGVYAPLAESEFEEIISYMIFPEIGKLNSDTFNPSSRSIAFRKKAWKSVGGYPEWLSTAEDTLFDLKLRKCGFQFSLVKEAVVFWRIRESSAKLFKQYFGYARGDGIEFLFIKSYAPRYVAFLIFLLTTFLFWPNPYFWCLLISFSFFGIYLKHIRKVRKLTVKRFFISISVAMTIEFATFFGYAFGNLRSIFKLSQKRKISSNVK